MVKTIYGIYDTKGHELVGLQMYTLFTFRREEQAIRYFADIAQDQTTLVSKHLEDYNLVAFGVISEKDDIPQILPEDTMRTVLTGAQLIALLTRENPNEPQLLNPR